MKHNKSGGEGEEEIELKCTAHGHLAAEKNKALNA
jgi:hypothetical protein